MEHRGSNGRVDGGGLVARARREMRQDGKQLLQDRAAGNTDAVKKDRAELSKDRGELRGEQRDLHRDRIEDRHDVNHDKAKLRTDRHAGGAAK
jgi:hypothetical protein